jgi:hypothetical protein
MLSNFLEDLVSEKICPVCGSGEISRGSVKKTFSEAFASSIEKTLVEYTCSKCGESGDFFNENEEVIASTIAELKSNAVKNILDFFSGSGLPFSSIERLLGLPQRTLTKWKGGSIAPHAAGVTLLKYVRLFPWLLMVSENKFDFDAAQKIHINDAIQRLNSCFHYFDTALSATLPSIHSIGVFNITVPLESLTPNAFSLIQKGSLVIGSGIESPQLTIPFVGAEK